MPNSFTHLQSLQTLNISSNLINSVLPASLFTLPKPVNIDISNNQFSGTIPSTTPPTSLITCKLIPNKAITCPSTNANAWAGKCGVSCSSTQPNSVPPNGGINPEGPPPKGKNIPQTPLPGESLGQQQLQVQPDTNSKQSPISSLPASNQSSSVPSAETPRTASGVAPNNDAGQSVQGQSPAPGGAVGPPAAMQNGIGPVEIGRSGLTSLGRGRLDGKTEVAFMFLSISLILPIVG